MKTNQGHETIKAGTSRVWSRATIGTLRNRTWLLAAAVLISITTAQAGADGVGGKRGFDTMTVNLYIGGGIDRVIALDPANPDYLSNLVFTVTGVYYEIVASQPAARMQGVADAIAARLPDIVAVQEATLLRNQSPGDLVVGGTTPATNVVFDYLGMLVSALNARGAPYAVAATSYEWEAEMPMLNLQTGTVDDVRQTDRDAILVRTDLPRGQLRVSHPQSGHFTNVMEFPAIGLALYRGWCSVDVFVRGQKFRYVCTHPDDETFPQLQLRQGLELVGRLSSVNWPVILAGDFNADPLHRNGTQTYDVFVAAGFRDAWAATQPDDLGGGLTWGHDEFLADPTTAFIWQLDHVFCRGAGFVPTYAEVIDMELDRTQPPFWASDHAAFSAGFSIERAPFAALDFGATTKLPSSPPARPLLDQRPQPEPRL
jgi:endonuclease/exonuclease/phosphatase family metal-dependent hydrolase